MIATAPSSGTIPSRLRSNAAPTCHILLAGQDSDELDAVGRQLGGAYCLLKARNDRNALHIIEAQSIHLIIALDDGHRLCAHVKSSIDHAHIPVILLTDGGTVSSRIKCLESGADACLERPVPAPYLKAQIKNLLTNRARIKDYFAHSLYAHMAGMTFSRENEAFLSRLNNLISDNLRNMDLSVDILARLMNMSRPTFYRKIKCLSDLTPNELINTARLNKAAELISTSDFKVFEVTKMVGFNSQSNFGKAFMKQFNVTPTEFQKKNQRRKAQA